MAASRKSLQSDKRGRQSETYLNSLEELTAVTGILMKLLLIPRVLMLLDIAGNHSHSFCWVARQQL
jgi:hypothetical protein